MTKSHVINIIFMVITVMLLNGCGSEGQFDSPDVQNPDNNIISSKFAWYEEEKKSCAIAKDESSCIKAGQMCVFNKETKICEIMPLEVCGNDSELYPGHK